MIDGLIKFFEWIIEKGIDHFSPIFIVSEYESGVLLRLGKYKKNLSVGINFKIPFLALLCLCFIDHYSFFL